MKKLKSALVLALTLTLTACGGGGSDGNNSAPTLTIVDTTELDELTTKNLSFSTEDKDGDTVSVSVSSTSEYLSARISDSQLVLNANNVPKEEIAILEFVATDGKLSTTKTISVKIVDVLVLDVSKTVSLNEYQSVELDVTLTEGLTPKVTSSNTEILLAKYENNKIILNAFDVTEDIEVSVLVELEDSSNRHESETINVTVLNNPDITDVDLSINIEKEKDEDDRVIIYSGVDEYLNIELFSTDEEDKLTWSLESYSANNELDKDYLETVEKEGDLLKISVKYFDYTKSRLDFNITLRVSSGRQFSEETFNVRVLDINNKVAKISFNESQTYNNFGIVEEGKITTFDLNILDDFPENVKLIPETVYVYQNNADITHKIDVENNTITINPNSAVVGDQYGILIFYNDIGYRSSFNLNFMVSHVIDEERKDILDLSEHFYKKIASLREYQYLAEFYAELLENENLLPNYFVEKVIIGSKTDDSGYYFSAIDIADYMSRCALFGEKNYSDPDNCIVYIDSYVESIESYIESAARTYTLKAYDYVNSLSTLPSNTLPKFEFEDSLYLYDTENNLYSRFNGNQKYGEFIDGEFVFSEEYEFLKAIVEKSAKQAFNVYDYNYNKNK
ncbi:hypothetical protein NDQ71_16495 [Pseudoalteromonas sp. KG3]|uniref:hypothetical protein n=1 Tax=Pseudoalteromonas sp. KG3 TaxID=2951137 RepID=UPI00265894F8|nr:hypothetical protein [Pseudoalteromonas sp. KG3]WKD23198.1 hypothetical protein NDQ71_16495 [Pseudoalteromonas sp. KG3]